jgi:protein-tyrosine phosphatase
MLNLRKVDNRFYLSGGWQDIFLDVQRLKLNKIGAVLDLQYTFVDEIDNTVPDALEKEGIEYKRINMYDGEYNQNIGKIFDEGAEWLAVAELKVEPKKFILVKCGAGVSRSAAMLINYLCMARRLTYSEVLNNIKVTEENGKWLSGMMLGVSLDPSFDYELKKRYPDYDSAFGEKEF